VLKGDVNSGEILDFYANGSDLIKIELRDKEACKVSELDGEYIASWYLVGGQGTKTIIDNQEPDFQGSETLILDGCVGEFEGVESFQPSKELRKRLHVAYKPDGQITVYGNLDLWEVGRTFPTILEGDVNSGEISGILKEGDLIKIEIINKAQLIAEEKRIAEAARIAAKEELAACKVSELNGEYIATWFLGDVNNNEEPESMGSESLFLNACVGEFEGVKNFQPAKELRKNLQVSYKTNGQITISGHIDLWEVGRSFHTELEGDINSGEISGVWEEGDLIKIEITKVNN
jgi:hypothetical protein